MKTAVITGITGGIGGATARLLAANGYRIVSIGRREIDASAFPGAQITHITGDIQCREDRERLIEAAKSFQRIDVLINVAGVAPLVRRDILEMSEESYDRVMDINLKGAFFLTQEIAKHMLTQEAEDGVRGSIVNVSSCSAYTSSVSRGEYCISKAGMSMMTLLFADRLAGEGITVNDVCPGIIETDMTKAVKEKYDKRIAEGLVPMGRWGQPEDVAKVIYALCDGTFGYTTGQSITIDGGMHIRRL